MSKKIDHQDPSGAKAIAEATRALLRLNAEQAYHLELFGNDLAAREGYKEHKGLEALQFYLVQKHHWKPSDVRAMNWEDLRFIFAEEMSEWTVPKELRD